MTGQGTASRSSYHHSMAINRALNYHVHFPMIVLYMWTFITIAGECFMNLVRLDMFYFHGTPACLIFRAQRPPPICIVPPPVWPSPGPRLILSIVFYIESLAGMLATRK